MASIITLIIVWFWIIVGSIFVTGGAFVIPVLKIVNDADLNFLHYLWAFPVWLFGAFLLIYAPIAHFVIAIPLAIWGFIAAPKETGIVVAVSAAIVGGVYYFQYF